MTQFPLLSVITLLPLVGGLILLALPGERLPEVVGARRSAW